MVNILNSTTETGYSDGLDRFLLRPSHSTVTFSSPINGYIVPVLIALTVVTNSLIVAVLLKKHMRSPTNVLLAGIAFSDMMTGVIPLPVFIYFFSMGHYQDFVPYRWCYPYKMLYEVIPTIFHTASIWLTVGLAALRCLYICQSPHTQTWCTIPNVIRATLVLYALAMSSQICKFFDFYVIPTTTKSLIAPNSTFESCIVLAPEWVNSHEVMYHNIYYWFRIIFIHLVPCTSLVILNGLLIFAVRMARVRRTLLVKQNRRRELRNLKENNFTTLMLVVVVGVFLAVEFPLGVIMTIFVTDNTFSLKLLPEHTYLIMTFISNFLILLSYPLNFFIYCAMSRQFRETFKRLFHSGSMPLAMKYSQYMTIPNNNEKTIFTGPETAL